MIRLRGAPEVHVVNHRRAPGPETTQLNVVPSFSKGRTMHELILQHLNEIKEKNTDVRQTIEKMFAELSSVKTDRTLLASLFVEVAKCLNQDLGSKSVKGMGSEPMSGLAAGKNAL
jgi:hypothetical protein